MNKQKMVTEAEVTQLREDVKSILLDALSGYTNRFKSGSGYVQWGKVEEAIGNRIMDLLINRKN